MINVLQAPVLNASFVIDTIGMLGFALAGILAARGRGIDPIGVFVMAFTTAFGGGLVRDILIDNRPFYWVAHQEYVWGIVILTIFAPRIVDRLQQRTLNTLYVWADAVGLGAFTASGTLMANEIGFPSLAATLMGVCTSVFGGLLRDVFLNRVPLVLSDRQPYAIVSFVGGWLLLILIAAGIPSDTAGYVTCATVVALRMSTLTLKLEIRYWTKISERIFPGNGPLPLEHQIESALENINGPEYVPAPGLEEEDEKAKNARNHPTDKQSDDPADASASRTARAPKRK